MSKRCIWILGFLFISLLSLSLAQSIEAQVQPNTNGASSINSNLVELPITIYGLKNPKTGEIDIKNWTINEEAANKYTNMENEETSPQDLKQLGSNCNAILNYGELISTYYIIIGKINNSSIVSDTDFSPLRLDLHEIKNADFDKILLQSKKGFMIEPQIVNIVCKYGDSLLNNTNIPTSSTKFVSLFSESCPQQFEDTIYHLNGQFNNKFNLNFTLNNSSPNIKIAFQTDIMSEKVKGYISNYRIGAQNAFSPIQGNFTLNSISLSCSLQPLS